MFTEDIGMEALATRRVTFRMNVKGSLLLMGSVLCIHVACVDVTEMRIYLLMNKINVSL